MTVNMTVTLHLIDETVHNTNVQLNYPVSPYIFVRPDQHLKYVKQLFSTRHNSLLNSLIIYHHGRVVGDQDNISGLGIPGSWIIKLTVYTEH